MGTDDNERVFIPRRYEQMVTFIAAVVSIAVPATTALVGASPQAVIGVAFLFFFLLVIMIFFVLDRSPALSKLLIGMLAALMLLIVVVHFWPTWLKTGAKQTVTPTITVKPPRLEVRAWFDKPTLERGGDGKLVRLNGNGERDWNESYITPIEIRAPSRINSTLISRVPGYFGDFEPGETITAKVCGLDFDKDTYPPSDKRYTDQMIWSLPIPDSGAENCKAGH